MTYYNGARYLCQTTLSISDVCQDKAKQSCPVPGSLQYPTLHIGMFHSVYLQLYHVLFFLEKFTVVTQMPLFIVHTDTYQLVAGLLK